MTASVEGVDGPGHEIDLDRIGLGPEGLDCIFRLYGNRREPEDVPRVDAGVDEVQRHPDVVTPEEAPLEDIVAAVRREVPHVAVEDPASGRLDDVAAKDVGAGVEQQIDLRPAHEGDDLGR